VNVGRLYYGNGSDPIELSDRLMAHVKVVASSKLRRSESFTLTCENTATPGAGRTTIWVHCAIPLRFEFDSAEGVVLDRDYLNELARAASSTSGMLIDVAVADADERATARVPKLVRAA
jgi:hypothetical protein